MMVHTNIGDLPDAASKLKDPHPHKGGQQLIDTSLSTEEAHQLGILRAMKEQEEAHYRTENYFLRRDLAIINGNAMDVELSEETLKNAIDPECRFRMSEWCYQISDYCGYKRETVVIALSCLDRFVASRNVDDELFMDRSKFQLPSMVCFYGSVKIHEHEAMDTQTVATLSRGAFEASEVEEMEAAMLSAIGHRVNPPTALAFSKQLLDLIPNHVVDHDARDTVLELAKFQTEIAVSDIDLMHINASSIALAALTNAFESMVMEASMQKYILNVLSKAVHVKSDSTVFRDVRIRLYEGLDGS